MRTRYTPLIYSTPVFSESDFSDDKRLPRKVEDDERSSSYAATRAKRVAVLHLHDDVQYGLDVTELHELISFSGTQRRK